MRDGADDEWLSDGEATPIAYNPVAYKKGARPSVDGQDSFSRAAVHSTPGGTGFANVVPLLVGECYKRIYVSIHEACAEIKWHCREVE